MTNMRNEAALPGEARSDARGDHITVGDPASSGDGVGPELAAAARFVHRCAESRFGALDHAGRIPHRIQRVPRA